MCVKCHLRRLCGGTLADLAVDPVRVMVVGDDQACKPGDWTAITGYYFMFNTWGKGCTTEDLNAVFQKRVWGVDMLHHSDEIWIMAGSNDHGKYTAPAALHLARDVDERRLSARVPIWYFHNVAGAAGKQDTVSHMDEVYGHEDTPIDKCVFFTPGDGRNHNNTDTSIRTYTLLEQHTDKNHHLTSAGVRYLAELTRA